MQTNMEESVKRKSFNHVHNCIICLHKPLFLFGCLSFQQNSADLKITHQAKLQAFFFRTIFLLGFYSGIIMKLVDERMANAMFGPLSPVMKVVFIAVCISSSITYFETFIVLDFKRRNHIKLLDSMQKLDDDIGRDFENVNWNYDKTRHKYTPLTIMLLIVYVSISSSFIFTQAHCNCGYISSFLIVCNYTVITLALGIVGFLHIAYMDYLRLRYRLITKLFNQMYATRSNQTKDHELMHESFRKLCEYTKRCTNIIRKLNNVFGSISAAGIFYNFVIMTTFVFVICQKIIESEKSLAEYVFIALLLSLHFYKVSMMSIYGYLVIKEQRTCHHALMAYGDLYYCKPEVRELLDHFRLWRMHNDLRPTIGSYVHCNLPIIYTVMNFITSYVLVLIQLLFQQNSINQILKDFETLFDVGRIDLAYKN